MVNLNNLRWLFHFRIDSSESVTKSQRNLYGIGHAIRCISLAKIAKQKLGIEPIFITSVHENSENFLRKFKIVAYNEDNLENILKNNPIGVIISDINYLEKKYFKIYNKYSKCVCLAPRGQSKFYADLSFIDFSIFDEPPISKPRGKILSSLKYIVMSSKLLDVRNKLKKKDIIKNKKNIIISMGGVDSSNLINTIINGLIGLEEDWNVKIIMGPLYEKGEELNSLIKRLKCNVKIINNPKNFFELVAQSTIGIFAAGIVSYEAAALGTFSLNLSLTKFHLKRSVEIQKLGLGISLGMYNNIVDKEISKKILELEHNINFNKISYKSMKLIDGKGGYRVLNEIQNYLYD
jgi:spore coat polysaccharide biosynthesis predicted glycosyltransferase SpsG